MLVTTLEEDIEKYDYIIQDIKNNCLSKTKYPKLIIGTGLSISYNLPGMQKLAKNLDKNFKDCKNEECKKIWEERKDDIFSNGLEYGLREISLFNDEEIEFVNKIKSYTAKFILEEEIKLTRKILREDTGFKKLLKYLKNTASTNNPILDVMTPNYDRIIELTCDSMRINIINGFNGNCICHFDSDILKKPFSVYNNKNFYIRLFKPHGSLNWLKIDGEIISTNDTDTLKKNIASIEIVTPGLSKYQIGLTNETFRVVRERFNEILSDCKNYSLIIFGYGFNDDHFNTVLYNKFDDIKSLIVSKNIKQEIITKAMENSNITLIFEGDFNYIIHKKERYQLNKNLWDINVFSDIFFG